MERPAGNFDRRIVMKTEQSQRAFTLVELIVVIVLLMLIVGILGPTVAKVRDSNGQAVCLANLRAIGAATQSYANDDSHELLVPIQYFMVHNTSMYNSQLGMWSWRMVNWFAWGGATGSEDFLWGTHNAGPIGQFSTLLYRATTRPLTKYLYPDLEEVWTPTHHVYATDLPLFHCPDDRGYPDDLDIDDSPHANANRPCYDTLGNSYRASLSGWYRSSGGGDYTGAFTEGVWGQRRSDLTHGSRTVLFHDALFPVMPYLTDPVGWHGEVSKDNVLYVDGTARLTEATPGMPIPGGGYPPVAFVEQNGKSRGETYQFDCYPTPGAYIWGNARPDDFGVSGSDRVSWPFLGYRDNLTGG
jgi:type II secretory pathway pseudopilin PulG